MLTDLFCLVLVCGWVGAVWIDSEFGTNTTLVPPTSPLYGKQAFQNRVEEELPGLKTLRIFNGAFADCANPLIIS